jgi:hypothetical protein
VQSLKRLAESTPEPWRQLADSAVSFTERSIRTQQEFLERVIDTGSSEPKPATE